MSAGRVLILDDEAQIRRVLRTSLVASGFVVREARRGEEALEMLREEKPDLLIIDIILPGMSGFEVCHEIRDFSDAPIIMLSVRNNERDKVRALDSGADDYVVKPFGIQELRRAFAPICAATHPAPTTCRRRLRPGISPSTLRSAK